MKNGLFILFAIFFFAVFSLTAYSQQTQDDGNIFHVQTLKFQMPEGGSWAEFDSLTALLTKNVTIKHGNVLSQRILRHLWGSSSRQLIVITEYKNISDLVGEDTQGESLFAAAWSTDAQQKEFNNAYNKYWNSEHSDEIYQELPSGRK